MNETPNHALQRTAPGGNRLSPISRLPRPEPPLSFGSLGVFGVDDMSFTIEQTKEKRESFGSYTYRIYEDGRLVAHYWHDYRGDEHGIEFADGSKELWPVGRMVDFIQGGGPEPLTLSQRAVDYLKQKRP